MPSDYTGNPSNSHGVNQPSLSNAVQLKVPVDLVDPLVASSVNSPLEVSADWIEFLKTYAGTFKGVRLWNSTDEFPQYSVVIDSIGGRMYRSVSTNTNKRPSDNEDIWKECDFTATEIGTIAAKQSEQSGTGKIVCTRGAFVSRSNMVQMGNDSFRFLAFEVQNMPWDNSITVDMSGSDNKFKASWYGGSATLRSGGYQYGGQVGLNPPASGYDAFTLWAKKGSGDPASTCTVSVLLWGV